MLTDFHISFADRLGKFATNLSLNIPPYLTSVATLPFVGRLHHAIVCAIVSAVVAPTHTNDCMVWTEHAAVAPIMQISASHVDMYRLAVTSTLHTHSCLCCCRHQQYRWITTIHAAKNKVLASIIAIEISITLSMMPEARCKQNEGQGRMATATDKYSYGIHVISHAVEHYDDRTDDHFV